MRQQCEAVRDGAVPCGAGVVRYGLMRRGAVWHHSGRADAVWRTHAWVQPWGHLRVSAQIAPQWHPQGR